MPQPPHILKNARDERGQAIAEFAVVLPLIVLLLFAVIQFGIIFHQYVQVTDATRAGARKGVVSRLMGSGAAAQACRDAVRASASGLKQSDLQVDCSSSFTPGADITVTASYPYKINLIGIPVTSGMFTSKTVERVE